MGTVAKVRRSGEWGRKGTPGGCQGTHWGPKCHPVPTAVALGVAEEVTHSQVTKDEVTRDKVRWFGDTGGDVGTQERDVRRRHGRGVTRGDTGPGGHAGTGLAAVPVSLFVSPFMSPPGHPLPGQDGAPPEQR